MGKMNENPNVETLKMYLNDLYYDNGPMTIYLSYGIPKIPSKLIRAFTQTQLNQLYILQPIEWLKTRQLSNNHQDIGDDANRVMPIDIARLAYESIKNINDPEIIISYNKIGLLKVYIKDKIYECIFNICAFDKGSNFSWYSLPTTTKTIDMKLYVLQTYIHSDADYCCEMQYFIAPSFLECITSVCNVFRKKAHIKSTENHYIVELCCSSVDIPAGIVYTEAVDIIRCHNDNDIIISNQLLLNKNIIL